MDHNRPRFNRKSNKGAIFIRDSGDIYREKEKIKEKVAVNTAYVCWTVRGDLTKIVAHISHFCFHFWDILGIGHSLPAKWHLSFVNWAIGLAILLISMNTLFNYY